MKKIKELIGFDEIENFSTFVLERRKKKSSRYYEIIEFRKVEPLMTLVEKICNMLIKNSFHNFVCVSV